MKLLSAPWDTFLMVAIMLIASVCAQSQQTVAQEVKEGKVVTIAPEAAGGDREAPLPIVEEPIYWIGIRGRSIENAVLRTHLQLAEGMGVVVEDVVAESPAAQAGLRKHDIILRSNGDMVDNMQVLQKQVRASQDQPLELKIVRLGKQEKLVVVPALRPVRVEQPIEGNAKSGKGDVLQQLIEKFGARNIGSGVVLRGGGPRFNLNQMPHGASVSIQRHNDGPAQITVKQGNNTWQIDGDDEASLQQLPAGLRPFVERMLSSPNEIQAFGDRGFNFGDLNVGPEEYLLDGLGNFRPQLEQLLRRPPSPRDDEMKKRMERLEKRLLELQNRLNNGGPALPLEKTS